MKLDPVSFLDGIDENTGRRKYYLLYALSFAVTAFIVFFCFIIHNKTLIWNVDGWNQHNTSLAYYGKYLRSIVGGLFSGEGPAVADFDFAISEGSDIINTLNYYVIGEPINLLSIFFPVNYTYFLFNLLVILRLFFAGASFSELCFGTGRFNRLGVLAGSLSYVFCYWCLLNAARHPFFITPLIYLPLLILGVEKVLKKESPCLLTVSVALAGLSNFYFFYMLIMLVVVYCIFRAVNLYGRKVKQWLLAIVRVLIPSLCGFMIAGILLLPVLSFFLADNRMNLGFKFYFLYPLTYYSSLPSMLLTGKFNFWMTCGFAVPVLSALFLLFRQKGSRLLKSLVVAGTVFVLFPFFGQAFNAFSYRCNRWCFGFALLCCYVLVSKWERFFYLNKKEKKYLIICALAYLATCMLCSESRSRHILIFCALLIATALIFYIERISVRYKKLFLFAVIVASIACNSFWKYSPSKDNYVDEMVSNSEAKENITANEAAAVLELADDDFVRYSSRGGSLNLGVISEVSSTGYYWSLMNPYVSDFRNSLETSNSIGIMYSGYDTRPGLLALSATNYFVVKDKDNSFIPYGFSYVGTVAGSQLGQTNAKGKWKVYKNQYALPLTYCYDSCISEKQWEDMTGAEREEAMLKAVYLFGEGSCVEEKAVQLSTTEVPYEVKYNSSKLSFDGHKVITRAPGSKLTISFKGTGSSQTYLRLSGLDFERRDGETSATLKVKTSNNHKEYITFKNRDDIHYSGKDNLICDLGYSKKAVKSITITFPKEGEYSFEALSVVCMPMKSFEKTVNALKKEGLLELKLGTDTLSGRISLQSPKILCIAIPYSEGWRAYVDGQEVKVLKANLHYLALDIEAGDHTVELRYNTPYKGVGSLISLAGILGFAVIVFLYKRERKNKIVKMDDGKEKDETVTGSTLLQ